ncbi:glycosyl hydrolase family 18 protein [Gorillibacterium sp. sgz5001074]|uniref:glycosyl hydrolase family 18 protein n=1 Tax=Gorillibacterium sp. sgz5001074 TaxID=3446695 RepID=UPI003F6796E4
MEPTQIGGRRKLPGAFAIILTLLLLAAVAAGSFYYWHRYWPSDKHADYSFAGAEKPIFYKGEQLAGTAKGSKESLKLPFKILKELIDPSIYYEEATQSVIVTTENKVLRMKTSQLTAMMNEKPVELRFPVEKDGDTVYVPLEPLKEIYKMDPKESGDTGAILIRKTGDIVNWGSAAADEKHPDRTRALRSDASVKADIYSDVAQGTRIMIWGEQEGWYKVQLESGVGGFMRKADVVLEAPEAVVLQSGETKGYVPWKPLGGKINLTWQQVYNKNPDPTKFAPMPGLNVISPQWFIVNDAEGNVKHTADAGFVSWANSQNLQVWALFSNGFDPKRTNEFLATYDKRMKIIKQIVSYAKLYRLQGINIDFENVYLKDKAVFVQFVRELAPFLHEQGVVVSVDVTVKDGSETYSLFLDRKALAESVDYMMVMTYDEHWATSSKAGSVASLPWVEKGIVQIMKEDGVPPSKLLLGVPFYTRIWTETVKDGKTSVTSKAVGMDAVEKLLKEKKLTPALDPASGQNYVEYKENDQTTVKIWIEDEMSMKKRADLVKTYDLAGIASWSRGMEKPEIWDTIRNTLEQRP